MRFKVEFKLNKIAAGEKPVTTADIEGIIEDLMKLEGLDIHSITPDERYEFLRKNRDEISREYNSRCFNSPFTKNRDILFNAAIPFICEQYQLDQERDKAILEDIKLFLKSEEYGIFAEDYSNRINELDSYYNAEKDEYIITEIDETEFYNAISLILCFSEEEMSSFDEIMNDVEEYDDCDEDDNMFNLLCPKCRTSFQLDRANFPEVIICPNCNQKYS